MADSRLLACRERAQGDHQPLSRNSVEYFWYDLFNAPRRVRWSEPCEKIEKAFPKVGFWPVKRMIQEKHAMDNPAKHNRNNDIFWSDLAPHYLAGVQGGHS
jgi:hypothetical protein